MNSQDYFIDILNIDSKDELIKLLDCKSNTEVYGFFADPAEHSLSPYIYNKAFREEGLNKIYIGSKVPEEKLPKLISKIKDLDIKGANFSMPHKVMIMDYLDEIDDMAVASGAVNTVLNTDGVLRGFNTDIPGSIKAINETEENIVGRKITLLGLGGAGKAILTGLIKERAKDISVFVRSPEKILEHINSLHFDNIKVFSLNDLSSLKKEIGESDILINSTPVGMGKERDNSLIPSADYLHSNIIIMDIIYSPNETKLLKQGKEAGCKALINGIKMLIYQAEEAYYLYGGTSFSLERILTGMN